MGTFIVTFIVTFIGLTMNDLISICEISYLYWTGIIIPFLLGTLAFNTEQKLQFLKTIWKLLYFGYDEIPAGQKITNSMSKSHFADGSVLN